MYKELSIKHFKVLRKLLIASSRNPRGFTLIELIVYMGLFSIFLTVLTTLFSTSLETHLTSSSVSSVEQDGRFIMERIAHDVRAAESIVQPENTGEKTNVLELIRDGVPYTYALDSGNLLLTTSGESHQLNSYGSTISNLEFEKIGNTGGRHTVSIEITVDSTVVGRSAESRDFSDVVGIR